MWNLTAACPPLKPNRIDDVWHIPLLLSSKIPILSLMFWICMFINIRNGTWKWSPILQSWRKSQNILFWNKDKEKEINMYEALLRGNELLIPFNIISSKLSDFSYQTIKGLQALQKYSDQVNLTSTGSLPYPSFLSWLLSYAYFSFTFKTSLATYSKKSTWQVQHVTWMSVLLQIRFFPSASRKLMFLICALSGNPVDFWQT